MGGDAGDGIFHVVLSPGREIVAGDMGMPTLPPDSHFMSHDVHFYDGYVQDTAVRVAYQWLEVAPSQRSGA